MRKWVSNSQELTRMIKASSEFEEEDAGDMQVISNERECLSSDEEERVKDVTRSSVCYGRTSRTCLHSNSQKL
jgi:hypothetical protein